MKKLMIAILVVVVSAAAFPQTAVADDGAAIFKEKCAKCHGDDGSGDTAMGKKMSLKPLASADVQGQTDAQLTAMIATGGPDQNKMHQFKEKGLTDAQVAALVKYIRSLKQ